ncbi:subtilisin family serine protease [Kineosphaera limosa]|uniref:Putative peptidase S8 family protein n=1 Tax=Kineosphaera limosa NBRC 100340 TaxID=1184609 RepID=K6WTT1_9MICO|nr:S8 family serine peptidase [Kineosphaera limosa]NYE00163.1 subtilisin family serine protease [Kineosphaera limosa]GAB97261.1 putative peptidase S8 family protein [Kineosphaera limosa NBRC 100340]
MNAPSHRRLLAVCLGLGLVVAPLQGLAVGPANGSPEVHHAALQALDSATTAQQAQAAQQSQAAGQAPTAGAASQAARPSAFVVNVGSGGRIADGRLHVVRTAVVKAGGRVVQEWPQIGVLVVHSTRADFATRLRPGAATGITSVGPTRTVPITESLRSVRANPPRAGLASPAAPRRSPDPKEREQWGLAAVRAVGATPAAATMSARTLAGVTVAVVDSGIEAAHPDLRGRIDASASVDCTNGGRPDRTPSRWLNTTSGHGTHVAGIIAAARNGVGGSGVAPGVRLASVKVVNNDGFIYPEYAICGIISVADKGIRLANHSYYVDPWQFWCSTDKRQAAGREAVRRAFAYAHSRGVLSVAAAGNEGLDLARKTRDVASPGDSAPVARTLNSTCLNLPAELPGVVTVSAADPGARLADYSNYGRNVIDVIAPGSDIVSTVPGRSWAQMSGTSMAAPFTTGVLALLAARNPTASPNQLSALLLRQARDVPCPRGDRRCTGTTARNSFAGEGMVDASRAVGRP